MLIAKSPRTGKDGKTYWDDIGVALPAKSGKGWNVLLRLMPMPEQTDRGPTIRFSLFEQDDKREDKPKAAESIDDEIPF